MVWAARYTHLLLICLQLRQPPTSHTFRLQHALIFIRVASFPQPYPEPLLWESPGNTFFYGDPVIDAAPCRSRSDVEFLLFIADLKGKGQVGSSRSRLGSPVYFRERRNDLKPHVSVGIQSQKLPLLTSEKVCNYPIWLNNAVKFSHNQIHQHSPAKSSSILASSRSLLK